ncbi:haloacid dehalogenase [Planctomycetales bacterium]|nr:haloacid dehalogenase [Planctomycetales bacterium]
MFHWLQPDLQLARITELTPELLEQYGLQTLLLDVDCTLKHYRSHEIPPDIVRWLDTMKQRSIGLCLVSNGRACRIKEFAELVQIPFVAPALKPLPFGCNAALKSLNFNRKTTAMVGDQVFADLMAGKFAGLFTVLVTPLNPDEEPWFARMKRPLEKLVLKKKTGGA